MERPNFLNPKIKTDDIELLKYEPIYFQKIKELAGTGKLIKKIKEFDTLQEAQEYIKGVPQKQNTLRQFMTETLYVIGHSETSKITAYAITENVNGLRLDKLDLKCQDQDFYQQLDDFLFGSLQMYENTKKCPGVNLKNLILNENGKLFYVDSEPFAEYNIEPFEMAQARKRKLIKLFGGNYQSLLPKTANWILQYEAPSQNYKKLKNDALKLRRSN